jgi:hypothetical protein
MCVIYIYMCVIYIHVCYIYICIHTMFPYGEMNIQNFITILMLRGGCHDLV